MGFADHEIATPPTPRDALSPLTAGQRARLERDSEEKRLIEEVAEAAVRWRKAKRAAFQDESDAGLHNRAVSLQAHLAEACDRLIAFRESGVASPQEEAAGADESPVPSIFKLELRKE